MIQRWLGRQRRHNRWMIGGVVLALWLGSLSGCASRAPVPLIPELQASPNYFKILGRWTKEKKVYAELQLLFSLRVTYMSRQLLGAYVKEYARVYKLTLPEQRKIYAQTMKEFQEHERFFVAVFAPQKGLDELASDDGTWQLRVFYNQGAGGSESERGFQPLRIDRRPSKTADTAFFFPYVKSWTENFSLHFPARVGASSISLAMRSVAGSEIFTWERSQP